MRSTLLSYAGFEEPHFLQACSRCQKPLGHNSDIFMYRGDTPFCSQECRQEQIESDEAKERRWRVPSSSSSSSSKRSTKQTTDGNKKSAVQTGTVAVA